MKNKLFLLGIQTLAFIAVCHYSPVKAQTLTEEKRQAKYWNYRNRLKREFNLVGPLRGMSMTMTRREYADGIFPFNCTNLPISGVVEWGDALAHHGTYLSVLASEYKLLKINYESTSETEIELYYAISALSRIDKNLDIYFGSATAIESGVLTRDDIDLNFAGNWNFLIPQTPNIGPVMLKSESASTHRNDDCIQETFRVENIWSKDHIANLLYGLCMVKKLTDNIYIKPTSLAPGFYIHDEISRIVNIWMTKFSVGHTWEHDRCGQTVTEQENWIIYNDITNEAAESDAGSKLGNVAWPFNEMAKYITGNDYATGYSHNIDNPLLCPSFIPQSASWAALKNTFTLYKESHIDQYQNVGLRMAYDQEDHYKKIINNMSTLFPISAVSGLVSHTELYNITRTTYNYELVPNGYALWELAYCQFNNENSMWDKDDISQVLDYAPLCTNPANAGFSEQIEYWIKDNNAIHACRPISHDLWGYYSGLDYMLLYNLYRLQFSPNPNQEGGYSERSCECSKQDVNEILDKDNNPLIWPAHSVNINGPLTTTNVVVKKHDIYKSYNVNGQYLRVFEYLVNDLEVANNGIFRIQTDFKITANSELSITTGGEVSFEHPSDLPNTVYITKGSTVFVKSGGKLVLKNKTRMIVEEGAALVVEDGGELLIEDNAKLEISWGASLEVGNAAVNISDISSVLEIRGLIIVRANKTFTPTGQGLLLYNSGVPQPGFSGEQWNLVGIGPNSEVEFGNIKVQVQPFTYLYPYNMEEVRFIQTNFYLGEEAHVNVGDKLICTGSTFTSIGNVNERKHNGLRTYGQGGSDPNDSRVKIEECTFSNGKNGITSLQNFGQGKSLAVLNCTFNNLDNAVFVYDEGLYAYGNSFNLCNNAILTSLSTAFVNIESNHIANSDNGTKIQGQGFRSITAGNVLEGNVSGSSGIGGTHSLVCNTYVDNFWHVSAGNNTLINLSNELNNGVNNNFSWLTAGNNLFFSNSGQTSEPIILGGDAKLYLRNGYNKFDLTSFNGYYSAGVVNRSSNLPNGYLAIDIEQGNNHWTNYTPLNSSQLFNNGTYNGNTPVSLGFYSLSYNATLYPKITGTMSGSSISCPVSAWGNTYTYQSFVPGAVPGVIYQKNLNTGGLLNPVGPVTGTVANGVYVGQNLGTTINNTYGPLTNTYENNRFQGGNLSDLQDLANLNEGVWATVENWHINEAMLNDYVHLLVSYLKDPTTTGDNKITAVEDFDAVMEARATWLTTTEDPQSSFLRLQLVNGALYSAQVYRVAQRYSEALAFLTSAQVYADDRVMPLINGYNCLIENERKVSANEISKLEFATLIGSCQADIDTTIQNFRNEVTVSTTPISNVPEFSFDIVPNPVNSTLNLHITANMDIPEMNVLVIDSYNNVIFSDVWYDIQEGFNLKQIDLSSVEGGIYHVILTSGELQESANFILLPQGTE